MVNHIRITTWVGEQVQFFEKVIFDGSLAEFENRFFAFRTCRTDKYIQENLVAWALSMGWKQIEITTDGPVAPSPGKQSPLDGA